VEESDSEERNAWAAEQLIAQLVLTENRRESAGVEK